MSVKIYDGSRGPRGSIEYTDFPLLGEIDRAVELFTVLDVEGSLYTAGVVSKTAAKVYPLKSFDRRPSGIGPTGDPICPYCGSPLLDAWELDDTSDTVDCTSCGATYLYERTVIVMYDTTPVKAPKIVKANWIKRGDDDEA